MAMTGDFIAADRPVTRSELIYALGTVGAMASATAQAVLALKEADTKGTNAAIEQYLDASRDLIALMKQLSEGPQHGG